MHDGHHQTFFGVNYPIKNIYHIIPRQTIDSNQESKDTYKAWTH